MGEDLDRSSSPVKDSSTLAPTSVHSALGGGQVADVLLWKRRDGGIYLLMAATSMWFLFERAGYSMASLVADVLLLLVVILFFWAKSASLLNRPLPPIPDLQVSEAFVIKTADAARVWINRALAIAHDIAVERNVKLFIQVVSVLCLVSLIGSLFNFLTLVYIGVILTLTVPTLYDKYQDRVDDKLCVAHKVLLKCYRKIDGVVLSKIPIPKEKKTQ